METYVMPPMANHLYVLKPHVTFVDAALKKFKPADVWIEKVNHASITDPTSIDFLGRDVNCVAWADSYQNALSVVADTWEKLSHGRRFNNG